MRVVVYLPDDFMEKLREAYKECRSDGEVIVKHLMEVHSKWIEHRSFSETLKALARSYLVAKYPKEYLQYLEKETIPQQGGE